MLTSSHKALAGRAGTQRNLHETAKMFFLLGYLNNKVILGGLYLGGYALNRTRLVVEVGRPHPLLILK